jgi:hypothetical protein
VRAIAVVMALALAGCATTGPRAALDRFRSPRCICIAKGGLPSRSRRREGNVTDVLCRAVNFTSPD